MKTLNQFLTLSIVFTMSLTIEGRSQELEWVRTYPDSNASRIYDVAIDNDGNILGVGTALQKQNSQLEWFGGLLITKHASNGDEIWIHALSNGYSNLEGSHIEIDGMGNIYILGNYQGLHDIDPGPDTVLINNPTGFMHGYYLLKLNADAEFEWVRTFAGPTPQGLAVTQSGDIYIGGSFYATTDFDFSPATTANLTPAGGINGGADPFILKMSTYGNYVWAKNFGSIINDYAWDVSVDDLGNVYTSGWFYGPENDFDPGNDTLVLPWNNLGSDIFAIQLKPDGSLGWAKSFIGKYDNASYSITANPMGGAYIIGSFNDSIDLDPGSGEVYVSPKNNHANFVVKLSISGEYEWSEVVNSGSFDDMVADRFGNLYLICGTSDTMDIDPGQAMMQKTGTFFWGLTHDHKLMSQFSITGSIYDFSLEVDRDFNLAMGGYFGTTVDFSFGASTHIITAMDGVDAFLIKYSNERLLSNVEPAKTNMRVYPNPASEQLVIDNGKSSGRVEIYSLSGVLVKTQTCVGSTSIDISNFAKGTYILHYTTKDEQHQAMIIKI